MFSYKVIRKNKFHVKDDKANKRRYYNIYNIV